MRFAPCVFCEESIDIASDHQPNCPSLPKGVRSRKVLDLGFMYEDQAFRMGEDY
jgi:hypothetical protein